MDDFSTCACPCEGKNKPNALKTIISEQTLLNNRRVELCCIKNMDKATNTNANMTRRISFHIVGVLNSGFDQN